MTLNLSKLAEMIETVIAGDGDLNRRTVEPSVRALRLLSNSDLIWDVFEVNHQVCDNLAQHLENAAPQLNATPTPSDKLEEIAALLRAIDLSEFAECFTAMCEQFLEPPSRSWSAPRIKSDPIFGAQCVFWGVGTITAEVRVHPSFDEENQLVGWFGHLVLADGEDNAEVLDPVESLGEAMVSAQNRLTDLARDRDAEVRLG